jgi:cilia- and flagella-associated protein 57
VVDQYIESPLLD